MRINNYCILNLSLSKSFHNCALICINCIVKLFICLLTTSNCVKMQECLLQHDVNHPQDRAVFLSSSCFHILIISSTLCSFPPRPPPLYAPPLSARLTPVPPLLHTSSFDSSLFLLSFLILTFVFDFFLFNFVIPFSFFLKRSVREKLKAYRLHAIKKRFWSLLILLFIV